MTEKIVVQLNKPIEVADKTITQIELREPCTEDVNRLGYPYVVLTEGGSAVRIEPRVVSGYIARLGGVPPSTVSKLSLQDFQRIQVEVLGFFGMGDETPAS